MLNVDKWILMVDNIVLNCEFVWVKCWKSGGKWSKWVISCTN